MDRLPPDDDARTDGLPEVLFLDDLAKLLRCSPATIKWRGSVWEPASCPRAAQVGAGLVERDGRRPRAREERTIRRRCRRPGRSSPAAGRRAAPRTPLPPPRSTAGASRAHGRPSRV